MRLFLLTMATWLVASPAYAQKWVTSWAASDQGPYPSGQAIAQPELRWAFPAQDTNGTIAGAQDQSFRIVAVPGLWSRTVRIRLSNAFGTTPVTFDGTFIGLQSSGANIMSGSNRPVTFDKGKKATTVAPGATVWSDAVTLPFVANPAAPELIGRKLTVTFHVAGPNNAATGPVTWHALAQQTSYMTVPGAGAIGEIEDDSAFPNSTTSSFFLDALDVQAAPDTRVVVCLGDGLVDGAGSTLNGDDRLTDALGFRLRAAGAHAAVVNAGLAGNQVLGTAPGPGGPSALARLDRDVLGLSGVTNVIWLEGGNDVSALGHATPDAVMAGLRLGVQRLRAKLPGVKVLGATVTSTAGATAPSHAVPGVEQARQALNKLIRDSTGVFDGVIDFDAATIDRTTGQLRAEFKPPSTIGGAGTTVSGGAGDGLTPNRAGYIAMADAVDLKLLLPGQRAAPVRRAPAPVSPSAPPPAPQ